MKLLTHNILTSKCLKGVTVGYPLGIVAKEIKVNEVEFNPEFISRMIQKVDWPALCKAAENLGHIDDLPSAVVDDYENNEEFLKKAHHFLMEIEVINGDLICPETGRKFPVTDGIPNMLANEDEV
uniref:Multifunctional methyltransferase subunit TRM112-like protein n=1 Tax=Daphnia similis TaxID=35528 RepID=A0A4Y7LR48_9CRUS|nr:EOG090X0LTV [Daphnia similis]SVE71467.1 EOG090X0LTV [Daphnia similis]SVE72100.1 EOG090X0LTV [Daphnia similis]